MRPELKHKKDKNNKEKKGIVNPRNDRESQTDKSGDDESVLEFREKRKSIG